MKITISIKDPDVLSDAIDRAVKEDVATLGLSTEERKAIAERVVGKAREICAQWFKWGEYFLIEVDTEARTATVVKDSE